MNKQVRFVCFFVVVALHCVPKPIPTDEIQDENEWCLAISNPIPYLLFFFSSSTIWKTVVISKSALCDIRTHASSYFSSSRIQKVCECVSSRSFVPIAAFEWASARLHCVCSTNILFFWLFSCCCCGCLLHWRVRTHSRQIVHVNLNRSPPNDKIRVFHMPNEKRVCQFTFAVAFARLSHTFPIWIYFRLNVHDNFWCYFFFHG